MSSTNAHSFKSAIPGWIALEHPVIETVVGLLSKVPAPVLELVVDLVKAMAGSKTQGEAARKAMIVAAKRAIRA